MGIDGRIQQISEDLVSYEKAVKNAQAALAAAEAELIECLAERRSAEKE